MDCYKFCAHNVISNRLLQFIRVCMYWSNKQPHAKYTLWVSHNNNSCDREQGVEEICWRFVFISSPEGGGGRKEWKKKKKVICDTYSTQTEILLSRQSTSHIERNVQSEYISIPGMMSMMLISFQQKKLHFYLKLVCRINYNHIAFQSKYLK